MGIFGKYVGNFVGPLCNTSLNKSSWDNLVFLKGWIDVR